MRTKFSKTFTKFFFPVGFEFEKIVADWVLHLQRDLLWGPNNPGNGYTLIKLGETP